MNTIIMFTIQRKEIQKIRKKESKKKEKRREKMLVL